MEVECEASVVAKTAETRQHFLCFFPISYFPCCPEGALFLRENAKGCQQFS
jgi:hypothetical protein